MSSIVSMQNYIVEINFVTPEGGIYSMIERSVVWGRSLSEYLAKVVSVGVLMLALIRHLKGG